MIVHVIKKKAVLGRRPISNVMFCYCVVLTVSRWNHHVDYKIQMQQSFFNSFSASPWLKTKQNKKQTTKKNKQTDKQWTCDFYSDHWQCIQYWKWIVYLEKVTAYRNSINFTPDSWESLWIHAHHCEMFGNVYRLQNSCSDFFFSSLPHLQPDWRLGGNRGQHLILSQ